MNREVFRRGVRAGVPYAVAAFLLAISFGVIAEPVIGGPAAIVMSAILFAGSAQFAAGLLLNARYGPMGIALAPSLRGGPLRRAAVGQTIIDFSWAAASRGDGRFETPFMIGATLPSYPAWVGGTIIGVLAGDLIGDPEALGLDALFPAFFLCLLVEGELRPGLPAVVAALGAVIALALIPFTPAGIPVIAASAAAFLGMRAARR